MQGALSLSNFQQKWQIPCSLCRCPISKCHINKPRIYMNRTAISSISPPKYPSNTTLLGDLAGYMEKPIRRYLYQFYAPSWIYSFPLVMSDTGPWKEYSNTVVPHKHKANPIETMGILQPDEIGYYKTARALTLSNQNFTYSKRIQQTLIIGLFQQIK